MISYSYYDDGFRGKTIPEDAFDNIVRKTMLLLKHLSSGRITDSFEMDYPEYALDIKDAICVAADVMYRREAEMNKHSGKEVKSESNDGCSISYVTEGSDGSTSGSERQASKTLKWCLSHTGLLYRGN